MLMDFKHILRKVFFKPFPEGVKSPQIYFLPFNDHKLNMHLKSTGGSEVGIWMNVPTSFKRKKSFTSYQNTDDPRLNRFD